jgi:hypothetical protein
MFIPNADCTIIRPGVYDDYGRPVDGPSTPWRCSIISLDLLSIKTSVRADAAATRGSARELESAVELLFAPNTDIDLDYIIEVGGARVRVVAINRQYNTFGEFDHFEVKCDDWSQGNV